MYTLTSLWPEPGAGLQGSTLRPSLASWYLNPTPVSITGPNEELRSIMRSLHFWGEGKEKDTCSDKLTDGTGGKINLCDGTFWEERGFAGGKMRTRCRLKLLCLTDTVQIINLVSELIHKSSLHTLRTQNPPPAEVPLGNKCS